ncbi:hypothetical protein [Phenylobacterium montanum]|uniref:Uncharacterized protein n=1 Tax=Phenylobacterium montanum TaxID=2823693 RepID=A0A975FZX7_9CAUL|nr:hypothetical protein [Caulobacter sp. S6]QUD87953.1 hypothetical protein KCG34_23430 [Caulobacter sp. S6]
MSWRLKAWDVVTSGLIGVLVLLVAGCEGPPPEQAPPPPPMATAEAPPPPAAPDLAGGPPPAEAAPTPPPAPADQTASMAPIPNPEDMSADERARVYGHRYDQPSARPAPALAEASPSPHRHPHRQWARNTHVWGMTPHGAPAARLTAQRHGLRPSQPAPSAAARPAAPAPAAVSERLAQMQGALRGPVADGSGFVVSDDLAAGKPGSVTLTLPADLYARIRNEAAKNGLGQEARHFDVTASLSGDGYLITPAAPQTLQAPAADSLTAPSPSFAWQVQPQPGSAGGPLRADLVAHLDGAAQALPLLSLERPVKPAPMAEQPPAQSLGLFNLHMGDVDLPGLGKVPVSSILAVLLLILVVVVLVAAARHTAERDRAERRRARAAARAAMLADEEHAAARAAGRQAEPAR